MRFSRTHGLRGLGEFFWDDSFSTDFPDYYFDFPLVEVSAPDAEFTGQDEVLEFNWPEIYDLPSQNATTLVSQGYTRDPERSGGSSIFPATGESLVADPAADYYSFAAPVEERRASEFRASYGDSRAGQSSFIKDAVTAIPAAFKAITDYDLARTRLEIEKARTAPGRSQPSAKAAPTVRPDGSTVRVPVSSAGATSALVIALGAAGLFFLLRRR